VFTQWLYYFE